MTWQVAARKADEAVRDEVLLGVPEGLLARVVLEEDEMLVQEMEPSGYAGGFLPALKRS